MQSKILSSAISVAVASLAFAGCDTRQSPEEGVETVRPASAPLSGVADGTDHADRECRVVLREAHRNADGPGFETDCTTGVCYYVWGVWVDVADELTATGGELVVLYQSGSDTTWWEAPVSAAVDGAAEGYQRFLVRVFEHTVGPGMSMTSLMRTEIRMIPAVLLPGGGRIFDHNRRPGDFDNYELLASNDWSVPDDPTVCATAPEARSSIEFLTGWVEEQHGPIVAGGNLSITYDPSRLTTCRASYTFAPAWDIEAHGRFLPGGQTFSGSVVAFGTDEYGRRHDDPHPGTLEVDVPADATSVEMWFWNWSAMSSPCETYDSRFGENYRFEVISPEQAPEQPLWAGDWGNGLWRGCDHRLGLDEPVVLDSYTMQRACLDIYADLYVPGLTDGTTERPEWVAAQVESSLDGSDTTTEWLQYVGRVGNNYRYRWTLGREELSRNPWTELRYAFRFSTDGVNWYRIAQAEGPGGGSARTVQRGF